MDDLQADVSRFGVGRLFSLTSEAIVVADIPTNRIVAWNRGAEELFGYTAAEAVGLPLHELVAPELREQHLAGIARYRSGHAPVLVGGAPVDVPAVRRDGARLDVSLSLTDVSEDGERRYVLAVIRDMTAVRRAQRDLQLALSAMEEFVATASHDLRTPITTVLGFARTMLDSDDAISPAERRTFLEAILRGATHAARLVDDLLTLSQIQAKAVPIHVEDVAIRDAVTEAMERSRVEAVVDVDDRLRVRVDAHHLQRMLGNYLANARNHGGDPITVDAIDEGDHITIRVIDHGGGVPEAFVPRLFNRFARANTSASIGTGLGLSIVRGLAEAHGGSASYEPTADGSCFHVTLPASDAGRG